jgi:hypothetical protein
MTDDSSALQQGTPFNFWMFVWEGAIFGGAVAFVNSSTLLPVIVHSLGGPVWLVSLMPVLMLMGFRLPPIFAAHRIQAMRRLKPFLMVLGLAQRLPYGVAALVLLCTGSSPLVVIGAVAVAQLCSGIFGGIGFTAWQQMLVKCVPERKRHTLFALRFAISSLIGIGAGKAVEFILAEWPGATGYGALHLSAFILLMISYAIFGTIREPQDPYPLEVERVSLAVHLRSIPSLIANDRPFLLLLGVRFFLNGTFILAPFLAIHCQALLDKPDSYLGHLLILQMIGAIAGNATAAWLGHHKGSKATLFLGISCFAGMALWASVATADWEWQAIFALFGFAFFSAEVGNNTLGLEVGPLEKRATYLAIGSLIYLPGVLCASTISTIFWQHHQFFNGLVLFTVIWMCMAIVFLIPLKEPRRHAHT